MNSVKRSIAYLEIPEVINTQTLHKLVSDWKAIDLETIDIIILKGQGKDFCKGMDLNWISEPLDQAFAHSTDLFISFICQLQEAPCITIAMIDGQVIGGGVGICAGCDIVLASTHSTFSLTEGLFGLIPGIILSPLLSRISKKTISKMVFTATSLNVDEAILVNLIDDFSSPEKLENLVDSWVTKVANCKKQSIIDLKLMLANSDLFGESLMQKGAKILKERLQNENVRNRLLNLAYFNQA